MPRLTKKQRAFALEFSVDRNATQAAIRAGYSEKAAKTLGWKLKNHPGVEELLRTSRRDIAPDVALMGFVISGLMAIAGDPRTSEAGRLQSFKLLSVFLGPSVPARPAHDPPAQPKPTETAQHALDDEAEIMRTLLAGAVKH